MPNILFRVNDDSPPVTPRFKNSSSFSFKSLPEIARKPTVISHAIGGTVGSLFAECVLFPVDTVKLHVQTAASDDADGFVGTAVRIVRERGLSGLYNGVRGAMIKESIHSMNFWLWHGLLFKKFARFDDTSMTPSITRLLLSMMAKQLNWLCTVPFEAISTVNQLSNNSAGFVRTAVTMYQSGGVSVFYRGLPVSLLLAINPAIMNTLITSLLRLVAAVRIARGAGHVAARDHGAAIVGTATAVAKAVATLVTYPLIRAKVLQQTRPTPISVPAVLREVLAAEGFKGLYRGVLSMSYKTVLWNTLMMAVKHVLGPKRAITPPGSPTPVTRVPLLAREPFPAELVTTEKLNEILSYLKVVHGDEQHQRIAAVEDGLSEVRSEIREVKMLLRDLVVAARQQPAAHVTVAAPLDASRREPLVSTVA